VHVKTHKHVHTPVLLQVIKYAFASVVDREGERNGFCSKYCHRHVNHELCELKSTYFEVTIRVILKVIN